MEGNIKLCIVCLGLVSGSQSGNDVAERGGTNDEEEGNKNQMLIMLSPQDGNQRMAQHLEDYSFSKVH
jgi:hypothetical protein